MSVNGFVADYVIQTRSHTPSSATSTTTTTMTPPPDNIELGDVPVPKNGEYDDGDGDSDHGDDGNTALLGAEGRTRGTERWTQVSSIVLEVRRPQRTPRTTS